jgi:AcrR family transcriptional regulator
LLSFLLLAIKKPHYKWCNGLKNKGKQQRSRHTITTILRAAIQVLIDEGYDKATTNKIADRAGYSVGTLYQYFSDKEDIYGEIVDQFLLKMNESASNCTSQPSLIATLQTLMTHILEALEQDPAMIRALETLLTGKFRERKEAAYNELVASTALLLEAHRSEIVVEDLELAARIIVGATGGLATSENAPVLESPDMMQHVLRLQFAYLTFDA